MAPHWRRVTGRFSHHADSSTTSDGDRNRIRRSSPAVMWRSPRKSRKLDR
ncbi:Uncharacterised protein [Bordetella pertussis]|nr:Uncharacterised protein [Bordetella pertussis]